MLGVIGVQNCARPNYPDRLSGLHRQRRSACAAAKPIKVLPQHHAPSKGFPRYIPGHHPNPLRRLYAAVRAEGLLLSRDMCRLLRIPEGSITDWRNVGCFPSRGGGGWRRGCGWACSHARMSPGFAQHCGVGTSDRVGPDPILKLKWGGREDADRSTPGPSPPAPG